MLPRDEANCTAPCYEFESSSREREQRAAPTRASPEQAGAPAPGGSRTSGIVSQQLPPLVSPLRGIGISPTGSAGPGSFSPDSSRLVLSLPTPDRMRSQRSQETFFIPESRSEDRPGYGAVGKSHKGSALNFTPPLRGSGFPRGKPDRSRAVCAKADVGGGTVLSNKTPPTESAFTCRFGFLVWLSPREARPSRGE